MTPGIPGQLLSGSRFSIFQQLRDQVYLKCLQSLGQQAAPGANAAAKAGTFITKAGTFTTFDPPGSTLTEALAINPEGAITEPTKTQMSGFAANTAFCAPATAPSPRSILRAP